MLVLSRRSEEKVVFPTLAISLEVLQIRSNQVKLGIEAPATVPVLRQELEKSWQCPVGRQVTDERSHLLNSINRSLNQLETQWILGKTDAAVDALAELKDAVSRLGPDDLSPRLNRVLAAG